VYEVLNLPGWVLLALGFLLNQLMTLLPVKSDPNNGSKLDELAVLLRQLLETFRSPQARV